MTTQAVDWKRRHRVGTESKDHILAANVLLAEAIEKVEQAYKHAVPYVLHDVSMRMLAALGDMKYAEVGTR